MLLFFVFQKVHQSSCSNCWVRMFYKTRYPNRHESLFWLWRGGPPALQFIYQVNVPDNFLQYINSDLSMAHVHQTCMLYTRMYVCGIPFIFVFVGCSIHRFMCICPSDVFNQCAMGRLVGT